MQVERFSRSAPRIAASSEHYDAVTIWLHWSTVALVIILWILGQLTGWLPRGSFRSDLWSTHVALGLAFTVVLVVRLVWRTSRGRALLPADAGILNWVAKGTHYALYLLLIGTVGLGIANASYRGYEVYDIWAVPQFGTGNPATAHGINFWHQWAANLTVVIAFFHAMAALGHQYIRRDHLIERMRPPGVR